MHLHHQKGIPPTTTKDAIDHETYTVRKREKIKIKKICTLIPVFAYCMATHRSYPNFQY